MERSARMDEGKAIAGKPLHDEPFTAKQTDAESFLESDTDAHALGGAQKRIFLRDEFSSNFTELDGNDFTREGRTESHFSFSAAFILEHGHEKRFSGQQPFTRAEERPNETAVLLGAVTKNRLHRDPVIHVHHAPGLGDCGLTGIEFNFNKLHVVAVDVIVNFVHGIHDW